VGERVPEPETVPFRHDELQVRAVAQRRDHGPVGQAGDRAEQRPVEPAAQHGGRADDPARARAHAVQPPPDRVGERGGHPGDAQVGGVPAAVPLGQRPLSQQPGQDLLDQERDALGPAGDEFVHRGRQVGGVQAGPGHVGHRRRIEAAQRQHGGGSAGRERAGDRGGFAALLISGFPEGGETQHPFGGQVVGEVLQQRQRLLVGPVQVLQDEHAADLRSQDAQQAQYRLAEEDRRLLPRRRLRWPPLGNQPPQHRAERAEFLAGRQAPRSPGRGQRLGERPERRGCAAGHGPAGQDGQAALARRAHDLPDQPRLTDTGLSGQEHRAAATRPGRRQGGPQPAGFLVPPDQDRAQHLRHRISIVPGTGTGLQEAASRCCASAWDAAAARLAHRTLPWLRSRSGRGCPR
jgi:hypothetical protein